MSELHQHPVDAQKLIYSGKILDNAKTIQECALKDGDFLVLMVTKVVAKTSVPAAASSAKSTPAPTQVKPASTPVKSSAAPSTSANNATPTPAVANVQAPATTSGSSSDFVSGSEYEKTVSNLMEMGFGKDEVVKCLRAAFNNPERAVEYLMNGLPANLQQSAPAAASANTDNMPTTATVGGGDDDDEMDQDGDNGAQITAPPGFEALLNNPQFNQIRQLVQQQPQLIQPLLQSLGQSNPELLQLINQDPEAFMQLLAGGGGEDGGAAPAGSQIVQLTSEEMEAVNRLIALGFDRDQVIEAYLACDKNEMLAANFLFDGSGQ